MHEAITSFVHDIAGISIDIMELLSIGIILFTTVQAFVKLLKKDPNARIYLLHGQSIGLTFKLGREILRTVTVRNMDEILQIAMLIIIKAAMTWLIHWELSGIEQEQEEKDHPNYPRKTLSERVYEKTHPAIKVELVDREENKKAR